MTSTLTRIKPSWIVVVALAAAPLALSWRPGVLDGLTGHGLVPGESDFTNYWMGARLLLEGKATALFDQARYTQALEAVGMRQTWPPMVFIYPPSLLPLIGWAGLLPYPLARMLWSVLGLAALLAAAWPYSKNPWIAAALMLSPAVLSSLHHGQNGLFTGAVMLAALRLLERRPLLAGALIGLLSAKPQLALLLPVALLAARRWRVIAAAAASTLALFATSLLVIGPEAWRLYVTKTLPMQGQLYHLPHRIWQTMTVSPALETVTAGGSWPTALVVQTIATIAATALVAAVFAARRERPITAPDWIVLLAATFLASPYSIDYDLTALAAVLLIASAAQPELERSAAWRWGALLLWGAPVAAVVLGQLALAHLLPWPPVGALMMAGGVGLVAAREAHWLNNKSKIAHGGGLRPDGQT